MTKMNFLDTSHQTIGWFSDQSKAGRLELRPPFQRRPVWTDEEKAFLVDSILRGYPVPEVYVYSLPSPSGSGDETYAVVDGQQRLRACLEYLADGFAASFDVHKLDPLYTLKQTPWFGKRYSELSKSLRERFRKYKLIVRDLEGVKEQQIRHMFHRLNQANFVLNAQELRYSMYSGGLLALVEELVKAEAWDHYRLFTINQRRRMLDSEYITELVVGHLHWPQNKKDNVDHYYRLYAARLPAAKDIASKFDRVHTYLAEVFPEPRMGKTRWYRKSDFYTLFLALSRGVISMEEWRPSELEKKLREFSDRVSGSEIATEASPVGAYRDAVERAATDRARRVRREQALVAFLDNEADVPATTEDEDVDDDASADEEYEDR